MMHPNPFAKEDYLSRKLTSPRDMLLLGIDTVFVRAHETVDDLTEAEYNWEPVRQEERAADMLLPAETKRVWRVFQTEGRYTYDYGMRKRENPAFTTIAWILNHVAQTADMYLRCIITGQPASEAFSWNDLPVHASLVDMRVYAYHSFQQTRDYLLQLPEADSHTALHTLTPTPYGEMRPTYLNLWGGVIEHSLQHLMQIAVRKEHIRHRFE
jgi:hypothetical protein